MVPLPAGPFSGLKFSECWVARGKHGHISCEILFICFLLGETDIHIDM